MLEDKQKICELLIPVFRRTSELFSVMEIRYDNNGFVYIKDHTGLSRIVDVDGLSGAHMIKKIMNEIV